LPPALLLTSKVRTPCVALAPFAGVFLYNTEDGACGLTCTVLGVPDRWLRSWFAHTCMCVTRDHIAPGPKDCNGLVLTCVNNKGHLLAGEACKPYLTDICPDNPFNQSWGLCMFCSLRCLAPCW